VDFTCGIDRNKKNKNFVIERYGLLLLLLDISSQPHLITAQVFSNKRTSVTYNKGRGNK